MMTMGPLLLMDNPFLALEASKLQDLAWEKLSEAQRTEPQWSAEWKHKAILPSQEATAVILLRAQDSQG